MHNTVVIDKKPMLSTKDLIDNLKSKNIKFNYMSESEAYDYLRNKNNFHIIKSYTDNFEKYFYNGKFIDKYVDLDFAYLKDLSEIDYELRSILFKMIINIEHNLKLKILNLMEDMPNEDGYRIVNLYLDRVFYGEKRLHNSIFSKLGNEKYNEIYKIYGNLKQQKLNNIPIWKFLEIITFGELVRFYEFFIQEYNIKNKQEIYLFGEIVKLRNCVCHNNLILVGLNKKDNKNYPNYSITTYLDECNIGNSSKINKMKNSKVRQITYTIYMFDKMLPIDDLKISIMKELKILFFDRIKLNRKYYNNNGLLISIYKYFEKIITFLQKSC